MFINVKIKPGLINFLGYVNFPCRMKISFQKRVITLNIMTTTLMTLKLMILIIMTFTIMIFKLMILSIVAFRIMTFRKMLLSIMNFRIITFNIETIMG